MAKDPTSASADENEALLSSKSQDSDDEELDSETAVDRPPRERDDEPSRAFPPPVDPRFNPPPPSPWKRAALLLMIAMLFWLAYQMKGYKSKPKVVYASRYSKEFKYRPAASPIITEALKDGRVRVRGAAPASSAPPTPTPAATRRPSKRRSGKKKARKAKPAKRA